MQKKKEEKERKQKTASFDIPTHENVSIIAMFSPGPFDATPPPHVFTVVSLCENQLTWSQTTPIHCHNL